MSSCYSSLTHNLSGMALLPSSLTNSMTQRIMISRSSSTVQVLLFLCSWGVVMMNPCACTAGQKPGYFSDLLIAGGFITPQLEKHPDMSDKSLGLQVNQCIMAITSWQGILNLVRDLGPVFDSVNVSSAIHRLAKLFKYSRVGSRSAEHGFAATKLCVAPYSVMCWCQFFLACIATTQGSSTGCC